jgi:hypothetical protein
MYFMLIKNWCDATINKEKGDSDIIVWYSTIAHKTKKSNSKHIMYTYLHWDSKKHKYNVTKILLNDTMSCKGGIIN